MPQQTNEQLLRRSSIAHLEIIETKASLWSTAAFVVKMAVLVGLVVLAIFAIAGVVDLVSSVT